MPAGAPDMAFTPSDPKPQIPPITSITDLFVFNQYMFSILFGPTIGPILWIILIVLLIYTGGSMLRALFRWQFYDLVYPKPKKHHPK